MDTITINDHNLKDKDISVTSNKVRAVLLSQNKVLVSNYSGVVLFPGGKIDKGETEEEAIIRELQEETGIIYDINQLDKVSMVKYYQANYPTRNSKTVNRLMTIKSYLGKYNGININKTKRTKSEIEGNFKLELVNIDDLLLPSKVSDNPRKEFFDRENKEVIKALKKLQEKGEKNGKNI